MTNQTSLNAAALHHMIVVYGDKVGLPYAAQVVAALKELQERRAAIDKLARWLIHEDACAAINGRSAFADACTCGLDEAIAAVSGSPVSERG